MPESWKALIYWSGQRDSNSRPTAWEAGTLPLSYARILSVFTSTYSVEIITYPNEFSLPNSQSYWDKMRKKPLFTKIFLAFFTNKRKVSPAVEEVTIAYRRGLYD